MNYDHATAIIGALNRIADEMIELQELIKSMTHMEQGSRVLNVEAGVANATMQGALNVFMDAS